MQIFSLTSPGMKIPVCENENCCDAGAGIISKISVNGTGKKTDCRL